MNEQKQGQTNVPSKSYTYSRLFGTLYERGSPLEERINAAKAEMGEVAVKKGFAAVPKEVMDKVRGPELANKALAVGGNFKSLGLRVHEATGEEYLWLCVRNKEGRSFVSIPLNTDLGKQVVRKLANAAIDEQLTIQPFGSLSDPKDGRVYGNHNAGMWQGEAKVEGISTDPLRAEMAKLREKHQAAGIDAKTSRSAMSALELDWHRDVLKQTMERVNQHWLNVQAERASERAAGNEAAAGAAADLEAGEDLPPEVELDREDEALAMGLAR